jgi:transposase-like protein
MPPKFIECPKCRAFAVALTEAVAGSQPAYKCTQCGYELRAFFTDRVTADRLRELVRRDS